MSISNNYNCDSPIAFFDSGVGGLTVLNKVKKLLPDESYIYYGDTLHVPYGEKSKEELLEYSDNIIKFFESKHCKAVVMACNTTSSVIYDSIKDKYNLKIYPIVQSVAEILAEMPIDRLGVFATRATINSNVYPKEIGKYNPRMSVFGQHCPNWVNIVENNTLDEGSSIEIVKTDLDNMMKNNPEKIVLGCTHYPFLLKILSKFAPAELFIDPAENFAQYIKADLEKSSLLVKNKLKQEEFYVSSAPEKFFEASKMFYNLNTKPKLLTF